MTLHTWLAFLLATAVLLAVPGPTVLMVIGQSLGAGRRAPGAGARCRWSRAWRSAT